ncbi:hypothetical protein D3C86_2150160 [compost metagenome]
MAALGDVVDQALAAVAPHLDPEHVGVGVDGLLALVGAVDRDGDAGHEPFADGPELGVGDDAADDC